MIAGVQVSLEDAEVVMAIAHRTSIAGQVTCAPYKVISRPVSCFLGADTECEGRGHSQTCCLLLATPESVLLIRDSVLIPP